LIRKTTKISFITLIWLYPDLEPSSLSTLRLYLKTNMSSSLGFTKVHNMSILAGASSSAWERDTRDPAATIAAARYSSIVESVNTRTSRELSAPISVLASAGLSPREPSQREAFQPRAITPSSARRPGTSSSLLPIPSGFNLPQSAPSVDDLPGFEGPYAAMGEAGGSARKTVRVKASDTNDNNNYSSARANGGGGGYERVSFSGISHSGPPSGAGVNGGVFSGTRTSFGPSSPTTARRDERGPNFSAAAVATGMAPLVEVQTTSLTRALQMVDSGSDMRWGSLSLRAKSPLRGSRNTGSLGDQLVREGVLKDELGYLRLENERLRKELDAERRARIEAQARSPLRWVEERVAQRSGTSHSVAIMRDTNHQRSSPLAQQQQQQQQSDEDDNSLKFEQASEDGEFGAVIVHAQHAETVSKALHRSSSPIQKDVVVKTALAAASSSLSPRTSRSPQETGSLLVEKCMQGDAAGAASLVEFADLVDMDVTFDCDSITRTTPLIWACFKGHERLAILLADRGADVTAVAGNGDTALSAAIKKGLQEASLVLINKGSDILHMDRVRGDGGQSLIEYCYRRPLGMALVSKRLAELGAGR